ncbi:hypothetical protein [Rhodococcus jostii]|uniref:hypothetical protein n=1 Tax=Rhodococcus jostii TaxID=132919 RepID=UPI003638ECA0
MTDLMSDADLAELNGEVIEIPAQALDVLPPDVQTKVQELSPLDGESQMRHVTALLSHSRTGLLAAIAAQDLPGIVAFKAKAGGIREIAKQLRLAKDMQLDAVEFVRRAESGVAGGIREGQASGSVSTTSSAARARERAKSGTASSEEVLPSPTDFATSTELYGGRHAGLGIYAMVDGVSAEQFEEALAEARAEGNLSRANVARKCKAKAKSAAGEDSTSGESDDSPDGVAPKPAPTPRPAGGPKGDPNEMLGNIDGMLRGIVGTLDFIRPEDIDDAVRVTLTSGIVRSINLIRKSVKEIANG